MPLELLIVLLLVAGLAFGAGAFTLRRTVEVRVEVAVPAPPAPRIPKQRRELVPEDDGHEHAYAIRTDEVAGYRCSFCPAMLLDPSGDAA